MKMEQRRKRNLRAETLDLMVRDSILPTAIGGEIEYSGSAVLSWCAGAEMGAEFEISIGEFLDARAMIWPTLARASEELRARFGERLIRNVANLVEELTKAKSRERRSELRDHVFMYLVDMRRLIDLTGEVDAKSANR